MRSPGRVAGDLLSNGNQVSSTAVIVISYYLLHNTLASVIANDRSYRMETNPNAWSRFWVL